MAVLYTCGSPHYSQIATRSDHYYLLNDVLEQFTGRSLVQSIESLLALTAGQQGGDGLVEGVGQLAHALPAGLIVAVQQLAHHACNDKSMATPLYCEI